LREEQARVSQYYGQELNAFETIDKG